MFLSAQQLLMLKTASLETFYMVSLTTALTVLAGVPLGILLVVVRPGHILENRWAYRALGLLVNATRSVPFPIFIVFVIPLTRFVVGTSIGSTAVIVPLTLAALVLMARLTETCLLEVPHGVIEAAQSMGASSWRIVTLISYSAMAGAVGGGGLGDLAIRYGYHRYQTDIMWATVILLVIVVQLVQYAGDRLVLRFTRR
jgi:ABC-type methionine transport system permease subunit